MYHRVLPLVQAYVDVKLIVIGKSSQNIISYEWNIRTLLS